MVAVDVVARIAPEVDRLVWAVAGGIPSEDTQRLDHIVRSLGWEDPGYLTNLVDFMTGPGLTDEVAHARTPYAPVGSVDRWLTDLADTNLIESSSDGWVATEKLVPLADALAAGRSRAAYLLWHDRVDAVTTATGFAKRIADAAGPDHVVAVAHRSVGDVDDPYLALYHRCVTLRYLRQHDHRMAWLSVDLTPEAVSALTELWHGGVVDTSGGLTTLADLGLATREGAMTDLGRTTRDEIEAETNRRNAEHFGVLDDTEVDDFLNTLRLLPG
ncbi:MAG: hypothetical protein KDB69_03005 [Acidimicrobiia bacterium]|nr:hypothetical protein [Acidimicrobiia bacterium]